MGLGNGETNGIAEPLTKRSGGDFDPRGVVGFWMAGCDTIYLTKLLDVIQTDSIAKQMKEGILKHAAVAIAGKKVSVMGLQGRVRDGNGAPRDSREDETITIDPIRILWVEGHEFVE